MVVELVTMINQVAQLQQKFLFYEKLVRIIVIERYKILYKLYKILYHCKVKTVYIIRILYKMKLNDSIRWRSDFHTV